MVMDMDMDMEIKNFIILFIKQFSFITSKKLLKEY